jgi:hypothetical protein
VKNVSLARTQLASLLAQGVAAFGSQAIWPGKSVQAVAVATQPTPAAVAQQTGAFEPQSPGPSQAIVTTPAAHFCWLRSWQVDLPDVEWQQLRPLHIKPA